MEERKDGIWEGEGQEEHFTLTGRGVSGFFFVSSVAQTCGAVSSAVVDILHSTPPPRYSSALAARSTGRRTSLETLVRGATSAGAKPVCIYRSSVGGRALLAVRTTQFTRESQHLKPQ